jgi:single-stranded-DNA-specific exonuclease
MWYSIHEFTDGDAGKLKLFTDKLTKTYDLSSDFSKLLWARGIRDSELVPELMEQDFPEVFSYFQDLYDTKRAAEVILDAIRSKHKIFIYGDYDVDGITSTSLLWRFLYYELNADVIPFVPHRGREGYGLNMAALTEILKDIKDEVLLITVDTGIRENKLISELRQKFPNLKVIVTDHHQLNEGADASNPVPAAEVVVHPLHKNSKLTEKEICACAVTWGLVCAIRSQLKLKNNSSGLELVALATVCDVMPMVDINRKLVKMGLEQFKKSEIPGIVALLEIADVQPKDLEAYHLGYVLGPRVNAAGRIGEPLEAVRMFCTNSKTIAYKYAVALNRLNQFRQLSTNSAILKADEALSGNLGNLIFVYDPEWEEGVVGLIAGKLQEKYGRPAIAATRKEDGTWVGSARSNAKVDITNMLSKQADLLERFGGHVQAAGFNVSDKNLKQFINNLQTYANENVTAEKLKRDITYDLDLEYKNLTERFIDELKILEPYGPGNLSPKFLFSNLYSVSHRLFGTGSKHISLKFTPSLEGIWFNHNFPVDKMHHPHDFIASLGYNEWQGRKTPQLKIKHHRLWQS